MYGNDNLAGKTWKLQRRKHLLHFAALWFYNFPFIEQHWNEIDDRASRKKSYNWIFTKLLIGVLNKWIGKIEK